MIDDYRILTNGEKYKVQRRYYTLLRRREVWQDETETVGAWFLFDTYLQALDYVQARVKQDAPEIWWVVPVPCNGTGKDCPGDGVHSMNCIRTLVKWQEGK